MATFRYSAYKPDGSAATGVVEAESVRDAMNRLRKDGVYPREIVAAEATGGGRLQRFFGSSVSLPDLALMTRRLATLLAASVPVYEAVTTLLDQEQAGELKAILGRIRDRLSEGGGLASALGAEPQVFSESYVNMVAAGEASGALEIVLERLAEFLEDQAAIRSKIVTALAYPALMVVVGAGVMIFLLTFVIPKIVTIFDNSKAALPLITVILIKTSAVLRKGWWAFLLVFAGLVWGWRKLEMMEEVRRWQDRVILRLPLVGPLVQRLILSRFSKVMGLLLMSGVPMIRALDITGEVLVNRTYRACLQGLKTVLIEGGSLSSGIGNSLLFPPLLVHMIGVGEKSGQLENMLIKAGAAFEKEFDSSISRFVAVLEPLLVLAMGVCVGTVVVAVLLPIFELNQLIK